MLQTKVVEKFKTHIFFR